MFFNLGFLLLSLASQAFAIFDEAPRTIQPMVVSDNLVVYNSTTSANTIYFSYLQYNGFPSIRIQANTTKRTADFRLIFVRLVEFSKEIPIEKSNSTYEFNGKGAWSAIQVEKFTESFNKKNVNILHMNSTFVHDQFQFHLNLYTADKSCFYGNYNLDPDAIYIVPTIVNFPYKYQGSSVAVEQVVASSDSGQVSSFLNVMESPFLGSLVISPNAYDANLGKIPVATSDFAQIDFTMNAGNQTRESEFQQMYVALGSNQQPKNVTFEEKFSVNLKAVAKEGYILTNTGGSSENNGESSNAAFSINPNNLLVAIVFAFSLLMLFY